MRTIAFLNIKGGVGKSTTSFNVAVGLADKGKRVLLVDFDPQCNTTSIFCESDPRDTIDNLIKQEITDVKEVIISVEENLSFIPSSLLLANTEVSLRTTGVGLLHNKLVKILSKIENEYDYCIIDCAPIINLLTINAIIASDEIIVPIKPDRFALAGFNLTIQNILMIRDNYEIDIDYKVLFTIVNRNNVEKDIIEAVRNSVGNRAFKTQIRNQPKPIAEASTNTQFVIRSDSSVASDFKELVEEILNNNGEC